MHKNKETRVYRHIIITPIKQLDWTYKNRKRISVELFYIKFSFSQINFLENQHFSVSSVPILKRCIAIHMYMYMYFACFKGITLGSCRHIVTLYNETKSQPMKNKKINFDQSAFSMKVTTHSATLENFTQTVKSDQIEQT